MGWITSVLLPSLVVAISIMALSQLVNALLIKRGVKNSVQYLYARAIVRPGLLLDKKIMKFELYYRSLGLLFSFMAGYFVPRNCFFIAIVLISERYIAPFLFAAITMSGLEDKAAIFKRELSRAMRRMIILNSVIVIVASVMFMPLIGNMSPVTVIPSWIITTACLLLAIWWLLGGPDRLIERIKKKLPKIALPRRLSPSTIV